MLKIRKNSNKVNVRSIQISLASLYILLIGPFLVFSNGSTFGSTDDYCSFSARYFSGACSSTSPMQVVGIAEVSFFQALGQGRFYQLLFYSLTQLVFSTNSELFVVLVRVFSIALLLHSMYLFSRRVLDVRFSLFVPISFTMIYALTSGYNSVTGLPLWMMLGQALILYAMSLAAQIRDKPTPIRSILLAVLFFLGVSSYEAAILQALVLLAVIGASRWDSHNSLKSLVFSFRYSIGVIGGSIVLYSFAYLGFAALSSSSYEGTKLSFGQAWEVIESMVTLSFGSLLTTGGAIVRNAFDLRIMITLLALSLLFLVLFLLMQNASSLFPLRPKGSKKLNPTYQKATAIMLISAVGSLLPNLPLALTERYRNWSEMDPMYLGALYSAVLQSFALAIVIGFLVVQRRVWKVTLALVLVSLVSSATLVSNGLMFKERFDKEWVFREVLAKVETARVTDFCTEGIYADYSEVERYVGSKAYRFWDAYVFAHTGEQLPDVNRQNDLSDYSGVLRFEINPKERTLRMLCTKVDSN
jgi:hypothetical protein